MTQGAGGTGSVDGEHSCDFAGIYTVTLSVTDDGGSGISGFKFVVVYDPDGGFLTGGGWIDSPAGAYVPDPDRAGRAKFGLLRTLEAVRS